MNGEWKRGSRGLAVIKLPHKKKYSLVLVSGGKISPITTFNTEEDAEVYKMYMDFLMGEKDD